MPESNTSYKTEDFDHGAPADYMGLRMGTLKCHTKW